MSCAGGINVLFNGLLNSSSQRRALRGKKKGGDRERTTGQRSSAPSGASEASDASRNAEDTAPVADSERVPLYPDIEASYETVPQPSSYAASQAVSVNSEQKEQQAQLQPQQPQLLNQQPQYQHSRHPRKQAQVHTVLLEEDTLVPQGPGQRAAFLDFTRIVAVFFVAIDHGEPAYGKWNTFMAAFWVLQLLFVVSGISYAMSTKTWPQYVARLLVYVAIGVAVNWTAWNVTGKDWSSDVLGVIFQFAFVLGLIFFCIILAPMRGYMVWTLNHRRLTIANALSNQEDATDSSRVSTPVAALILKVFVMIIGIPVGMRALCHMLLSPFLKQLAPHIVTRTHGGAMHFWGIPQDEDAAVAFLQSISMYCQVSLISGIVIVVFPLMFSNLSWCTWVVLAQVYTNRILFFRGKEERFFHGLDLVMLGMVAGLWGVRGRRTVGVFVYRYWFLVVFLLCLIWPIAGFGRFDEDPPHSFEIRARCNFLEASVLATWLLAADRFVDPKIFTQDNMDFMNDWALIVFLVHKAAHMMLLWPLNWVFIIAIAPMCWLWQKGRSGISKGAAL